MANTTPLVTSVTKPATNPRDADATPRVNIHDFCEEYYEDILPVIMDKVRRDKRKEVHARPRGTDFRDHPRGKSRPHRLDTSNEDCPKDRERFRGVRESYDDSFSHSYRDGNRSRHMKRRMDNESLLSSVSKSDSSDGSSHRTRMPNNVKTYDGTGDPEDHVKIFQASAHVERWAMPTWCHMFNSTLIGAARVWFDELPPESVDSYNDLKAAFLAYFMQQKKYVNDPVEIHNIKQKDGETIEDFMERFKVETESMKGGPECMRFSGFMHGVNKPELTKRLNEHVPKTMEEMMITTTAFIRGEAAAASKKKCHTSWKAQDQSKRQTLKKMFDFRGHPREGRGSNQFAPLQGRQKRFLRPRRIEELVRAGKLWYLIKEIKHGRDQSKTGKKETPAKDKPTAIYMIQSWQRMIRQKVTQSFERVKEITFPPLTASSSMEILYEHCFNRLRPEIKNEMVPATTSLTGFSGETIWPLGQLRLLVTIGDADHSTRAWMNSMIVRSLSPYNGITGRHEIREIQAVPSTAHGMLKFPVEGGIVTIRSTILIPVECTSVITSSAVSKEEGIRVPRSVVEHRLNIQEGYSPVWQKKKGQAPERAKAIQAEVQELMEVGIMREVYYHDWLSNPVMEKKHDGSWRMCVAFTDLNKASKRFRRYFQAHPITVITDQPIKQIMSRPDVAGRLQKWNVMLGEHNITYRPITSVKGQILADFLTEMPDENPSAAPVAETQQEPWTLFMETSCVDGFGAGLILTNPKGIKFTYALRFQLYITGKELDLSKLGEAPSSDISVCVAASATG
nr:hypothetical protein [Tanacetum cinerariifolium]